ncbi:MAG TPA: hypothetical protein VOB72_11270 [Candidatus Dormibacteraeota bacterium]|nr:hypothetical protein [Candidatus Dormibacteraeota bacterium]
MGLTRTLLVAGAGAALAYFLDPVSGPERRRKVREYWDEKVQGVQPLEADAPSPTVVVEKSAATPK